MAIFQFCGGRWDLAARTRIMGILNITPDSFSDGGAWAEPAAAVGHALDMAEQGADMIDIGAQSTRPGHTPVSDEEEWARLAPVLAALRGRTRLPLSIDTYYPTVARRALDAGAAVVNDVSGNLDGIMPRLAAEYGAGLIMMHAGGGSDDDGAGGALLAVRRFFEQAAEAAAAAGLPPENLCLDPGIGFGKTRRDDLLLLARLPELVDGISAAILVGASRKRAIAEAAGDCPPDRRLGGTLALHTIAAWHGAGILRVHDVAPAVQAARVTDALSAQRKGDSWS